MPPGWGEGDDDDSESQCAPPQNATLRKSGWDNAEVGPARRPIPLLFTNVPINEATTATSNGNGSDFAVGSKRPPRPPDVHVHRHRLPWTVQDSSASANIRKRASSCDGPRQAAQTSATSSCDDAQNECSEGQESSASEQALKTLELIRAKKQSVSLEATLEQLETLQRMTRAVAAESSKAMPTCKPGRGRSVAAQCRAEAAAAAANTQTQTSSAPVSRAVSSDSARSSRGRSKPGSGSKTSRSTGSPRRDSTVRSQPVQGSPTNGDVSASTLPDVHTCSRAPVAPPRRRGARSVDAALRIVN